MNDSIKISELFDLNETIAADIFDGCTFPWEVLSKIGDFIVKLGNILPESEYEKRGENVWVAKSAKVFDSAYINGPCIIGKDAEVRHCAFIRGNAIVGEGAVVGSVFTRRRSDCLTESSGLVVVDIDHLESAEETENLRQQLFDDPYLCPALVFISPTGRGVKAFVPCLHGQNPAEGIQWAMNYVHCMYDAENTQPGKGVDTSGKDLVRACFLCHDPKALLRKVVNFEL